jgi:type 1 glutamine amidotransferase
MRTIRTILVLLTACGAAALLAQQPQGKGKGKAPAGPPKIQALIITGINAHDWKGTTPILRETLEATGKFDVKVVEEFRGSGPETLAPYDLIVMNHGGRRIWGERGEKAIEDFVASGKGMVLYHFALQAFEGWTEFEKMSGGNWRPNGKGNHSPRHDWMVNIQDTEHPITKGMKSFMVQNEELYANLAWQPEGTYHVLATAWDDHSLYRRATPGHDISGPGRDQNILWTTNYGQGRVFITTLGHDAENVKAQYFRVTFARGAEWAATGNVTQPIPPELAAR